MTKIDIPDFVLRRALGHSLFWRKSNTGKIVLAFLNQPTIEKRQRLLARFQNATREFYIHADAIERGDYFSELLDFYAINRRLEDVVAGEGISSYPWDRCNFDNCSATHMDSIMFKCVSCGLIFCYRHAAIPFLGEIISDDLEPIKGQNMKCISCGANLDDKSIIGLVGTQGIDNYKLFSVGFLTHERDQDLSHMRSLISTWKIDELGYELIESAKIQQYIMPENIAFCNNGMERAGAMKFIDLMHDMDLLENMPCLKDVFLRGVKDIKSSRDKAAGRAAQDCLNGFAMLDLLYMQALLDAADLKKFNFTNPLNEPSFIRLLDMFYHQQKMPESMVAFINKKFDRPTETKNYAGSFGLGTLMRLYSYYMRNQLFLDNVKVKKIVNGTSDTFSRMLCANLDAYINGMIGLNKAKIAKGSSNIKSKFDEYFPPQSFINMLPFHVPKDGRALPTNDELKPICEFIKSDVCFKTKKQLDIDIIHNENPEYVEISISGPGIVFKKLKFDVMIDLTPVTFDLEDYKEFFEFYGKVKQDDGKFVIAPYSQGENYLYYFLHHFSGGISNIPLSSSSESIEVKEFSRDYWLKILPLYSFSRSPGIAAIDVKGSRLFEIGMQNTLIKNESYHVMPNDLILKTQEQVKPINEMKTKELVSSITMLKQSFNFDELNAYSFKIIAMLLNDLMIKAITKEIKDEYLLDFIACVQDYFYFFYNISIYWALIYGSGSVEKLLLDKGFVLHTSVMPFSLHPAELQPKFNLEEGVAISDHSWKLKELITALDFDKDTKVMEHLVFNFNKMENQDKTWAFPVYLELIQTGKHVKAGEHESIADFYLKCCWDTLPILLAMTTKFMKQIEEDADIS